MAQRRSRVQWLVGLFCLATVVAMVGIATVAIRWLALEHRAAAESARADLSALEDSEALQGLLYQKGLAASFFLTRDKRWLDELATARPQFEQWLTHVTQEARTDAVAQTVAALTAEYGRFDADRARAIAQFQAGDEAGALRVMPESIAHAAALHRLADKLTDLRRDEVRGRAVAEEREWRRALIALAVAMIIAIGSAGATGYLLARRIARPLGELVRRVQVQSAAPQTQADDDIDADEIGALTRHVNRLARQIAQAEKMSALGEVAAAVAHEVLNPLTGVKTALQVLARDPASGDVADTVAAVDAEIRRVEGVARRLVSYARPLQPSVRACALDEVFASAIAATRPEADARRVLLDAPRGQLPTIEADPELLMQVLVNLLVNACQASAAGDTVHLRVARASGAFVIEVADVGSGLAPAVREHLFTPFVTTRHDGHGLGLAVSQNIVLAHGGRIEARANQPRGTVFAVWLPEVGELAA